VYVNDIADCVLTCYVSFSW